MALATAFTVLLAGCGSGGGTTSTVGKAPTPDEIKATYRKIVDKVDRTRLEQTHREIAAIGNRIAGSDGERKALELAEREFRRLGFQNIRREPFRVTVPDPEAKGVLKVGDRSIEVFPMWPNLVRTSTCDVTGPLVYGGTGRLEELNGKTVRGSIVLLEFNSQARWRFAAKLGAKAVVFLEPRDTTRAEAEGKFANVPLSVPRYYLPLKDAGPVLEAAFAGRTVRLSGRQDWVVRETYNLLADLPGTDPAAANEPVLFSAFADSMGVVPALSPGAEQASGLASLLELARLWKERTPRRRPITFMVMAANNLSLQGSKEFVDRRLPGGLDPITGAPKKEGLQEKPWLMISTLELSSGSRTLGAFAQGYMYDYRWETRWYVNNVTRLFRNHADRLKDVFGVPDPKQVVIDAANDGDNRPWRNNIASRFALACEPMKLANMNAMTFATIDESRERHDTPFDTIDRVNFPNLARQTQYLAAFQHHIVNDTSRTGETSDFRIPLKPERPQRMTLVGGFGTLVGRVVVYDPQQSFLPDVSVPNSLAVWLHPEKAMGGVRGPTVTKTVGDRAQYRFIGLAPVSAYFRTWIREVQTAAFRVNPETGDIDHAPDQGVGLTGDYQPSFRLTTGFKSQSIVVFPCVGVNLYDLVDPQDLRVLANARVLDAETDAPPRNYGLFRPLVTGQVSTDADDTAVLFAMPGQRWKLLMGSGIGETRLILSNSTERNEGGTGYRAPGVNPLEKPGTTTAEGPRARVAVDGTFPDTALNTARDIVTLNQVRINRFQNYRILSKGVEDLQKQASDEIAAAEKSAEARDWAAAERHARAAWGFALRAHPVVQKTSNDVVNGVVFYLFLLIPFSYFLERLIFANRQLTKQIFWSFIFFVATFLLLRFIHPAFEIVGNPSMIFIGFVMGALSLIVIAFILGKFEASLKALKQQQSGVKEVDVQRVSVALAAFSLGVGNMRRRKARTILTTLTLVVMTFIVLSFTSIVSEVRLNEFPSDFTATYPGLLVRNPDLNPLEDATYRQIVNEFSGEGNVVRRTYDFGAEVRDNGVLTVARADRVAEIRAILGLDPGEVRVTRPDQALLPGGRWFRPGDQRVALVPSPVAATLKIAPEEVGKARITYAGVQYTVIGILDAAVLRSITDLDGDGILPPDMSLTRLFQQETRTGNQAFRSFIRLDPSQVVILPAEQALGLGGRLRTVGVSFASGDQTRQALDALMPRLRLNLYASVPKGSRSAVGQEGRPVNAPDVKIGPTAPSAPTEAELANLEVRQFSVLQANRGTGLVLILVQLVIAAVFVLNTMIASVYERTKEIAIFSSIGLAPNHIAMLFFAESLVYGVLGAVSGYVAAQAAAKIVIATNAFPGLYLNFSSTSAVLSAALVMGIVLLSTIYPARRASQIAAPAMKEEAFELEPDGDNVEVLLPFLVSSAESGPLMAFLAEWLKAYEEYTIGDFVTSGTKFRAARSDQGETYEVDTVAWLAPYDLGISQRFLLNAEPSGVEGVVSMHLKLTRIAGDPENWIPVNKRFLANLRKQFLTWRTLDPDSRERYALLAEAAIDTPTESPAVVG